MFPSHQDGTVFVHVLFETALDPLLTLDDFCTNVHFALG